jgi:crotonobetainyl-CoA:carnitine CoA-transferase CaiB-like acyl-CoA transferase
VFTSPPALGEHTASVLTEVLGKSQSEIDEWMASGVIG